NGGPYAWTSTGGGCSVAATGTVTVTGGQLGGNNRGTAFTITNEGSGCTSRPTISVPAGAGAGTGGSIIPTVYQLTPHNFSSVFNVPGVDYPIGYDTTLSLQDPTIASLPSGASFAGTTVTLSTSAISSGAYNSSTGVVTLTMSASTSILAGDF